MESRRKGHRICIRVEGSAALRCYKRTMEQNKVMSPVVVNTIPIDTGNSKS
jgi:hypothetical protein